MPRRMGTPELNLTIKEVAEILGEKPDWIWRRVRDGKLKSLKERGRHLIALQDLRRYVSRQSKGIPHLEVVVFFEDSGAIQLAREIRPYGKDAAEFAVDIERDARSMTTLDR